MELVDSVVQALDGTKLQEACSGYMKADRKSLEKLLESVDKRIAELEAAVAASERQSRTRDAQLPSEMGNRHALRQKVRAALEKVKCGETKHCNPMEPEARRMECNTNNRFGYNAQAVVDGKSQVIVGAEVTAENNDLGMLHEMVCQAADNTGEKAQVTLADKGYASGDQLQKAEEGCPVRDKCCNAIDGRDIKVYPGSRHTEAMRARMALEKNQRLMRKRSGIVEPVFAQIKSNWGLRRLQTHGLNNAKAVWDLSYAVYNMRKLRIAWV